MSANPICGQSDHGVAVGHKPLRFANRAATGTSLRSEPSRGPDRELAVTGNTHRSAIVTGASRGIGRAVALELAAGGCRVIVNYVQQKERAEAVVAEIRAAGHAAVAFRANVQEPEELDRLFAAAKEHFGGLDILVNNAGVGATLPLEHLSKQAIDDATAANVRSVLLATQRAAAAFGSNGGVVINVSS